MLIAPNNLRASINDITKEEKPESGAFLINILSDRFDELQGLSIGAAVECGYVTALTNEVVVGN